MVFSVNADFPKIIIDSRIGQEIALFSKVEHFNSIFLIKYISMMRWLCLVTVIYIYENEQKWF